MKTFKLGLIGYPLSHSKSPEFHEGFLAKCGLKGEYTLYPILPDDKDTLSQLFDRVRKGEIDGLNVTIPHKQNVIPFLDELTSTASAIGAVNTVLLKGGKLIGDNTDATGFLAALNQFLSKSKHKEQKKVLVLGAGGSARAVVYALINDGWDVIISARRPEQAKELVSEFKILNSQISNIEYPPIFLSELSLIVNTTPVGMSPNIEKSPYGDIPFPQNAAVYDLVYNPRETKFVKDARIAGLPATTGLGMLVEQAALSFEIWTGKKVPINSQYIR